jgi:hypothetical protein
MKLKFWQTEFEFDKDDAKIVIPLILLLLALSLTSLPKQWVIGAGVVYYLLFFFLQNSALLLKRLFEHLHFKWTFKCPYCKSREVIMQGYQGYHSDEQYAYYLGNQCRYTSVLVNERLIKSDPERRLPK